MVVIPKCNTSKFILAKFALTTQPLFCNWWCCVSGILLEMQEFTILLPNLSGVKYGNLELGLNKMKSNSYGSCVPEFID